MTSALGSLLKSWNKGSFVPSVNGMVQSFLWVEAGAVKCSFLFCFGPVWAEILRQPAASERPRRGAGPCTFKKCQRRSGD